MAMTAGANPFVAAEKMGFKNDPRNPNFAKSQKAAADKHWKERDQGHGTVMAGKHMLATLKLIIVYLFGIEISWMETALFQGWLFPSHAQLTST
jgi:hypothetical protein